MCTNLEVPTIPHYMITSPVPGHGFALALTRIRRRVVHIEATETDDLIPQWFYRRARHWIAKPRRLELRYVHELTERIQRIYDSQGQILAWASG